LIKNKGDIAMSRDYSYEIYSLRQQISTMSSERADILNKISILKQNKSKIQSKKSAISEQLSQYDLIKAKATSNFAGNRRDDFNNKVETFPTSLIVAMFSKFKAKPYFKADEGASKAPEVFKD